MKAGDSVQVKTIIPQVYESEYQFCAHAEMGEMSRFIGREGVISSIDGDKDIPVKVQFAKTCDECGNEYVASEMRFAAMELTLTTA